MTRTLFVALVLVALAPRWGYAQEVPQVDPAGQLCADVSRTWPEAESVHIQAVADVFIDPGATQEEVVHFCFPPEAVLRAKNVIAGSAQPWGEPKTFEFKTGGELDVNGDGAVNLLDITAIGFFLFAGGAGAGAGAVAARARSK